MSWYLAKVVYQIVCGKDDTYSQFDEQLRLIHACNEHEALLKAKLIGESEQLTFVNNRQQLVSWTFINVSELYCISQHLDGAEVYACLKEVSNATAYIKLVNDKHAAILQNESSKHLNLI